MFSHILFTLFSASWHCAKGYTEALASSNSCFSATDATYPLATKFNAPLDGVLQGVRLVHNSGGTTCKTEAVQPWDGCGIRVKFLQLTPGASSSSDATILYPTLDTYGVTDVRSVSFDSCGCNQLEVTMVSYDSDSPEIIWYSNSTTYDVTTQDEFILALCEAACQNSIGDNQGTSCAQVYFLYSDTLQPSEQPSGKPSEQPTTQPTGQPSLEPSAQPAAAPTGAPSIYPTFSPSSAPVTTPPDHDVDVPTIGPTVVPTTSEPTSETTSRYQFIDESDINFDSIKSLSATDYFNPGYSNKLFSSVSINLDTVRKVNLFATWLNSDTSEDSISLILDSSWLVYDLSSDSSASTPISFDSSLITTVSHFDTSYVFRRVGSATFSLDSYFVLYSGASVNRYSASTICSARDETYFVSGRVYKFENTVTVTATVSEVNDIGAVIVSNYSESKTSSFSLVANKPPSGGTCSVSPASGGVALETNFEFTCTGWSDPDGHTIAYNFIKDSSGSFLNTVFSVFQNNAYTRLSTGNQTVTAVVVDEYTLASCVTIDVIVGEAAEMSQSAAEFENWVSDTYNSILDDLMSNSNSNDSERTASTMSVLQAAYEVTNEYFEGSEAMVGLQEQIIDKTVEIVTNNIQLSTQAETLTLVSTLAQITTPVVRVQTSRSSDASDVYTSSMISNVLQLVSDNIIGTLIQIANDANDDESNEDTVEVTSDMAQNVVDVLSNCQEMRRVSNEDASSAKQNGNIMIDTTTSVTNLLLQTRVVGESYVLQTETLEIKASKISNTDYSGCSDALELSSELVNRRSNNGESNLDCTVMTTSDNIYDTQQGESDTFYSNFVLIDVTSDDEESRRRMSDDNSGEQYLSSCEPIIISFNTTGFNASDAEINYPKCSFYNETTESYESDGCYVLYSDPNTGFVQCACLHLTFFGLRGEEFIPEINYVDEEYLTRDISIENLIRYPLGWIVCLAWFCFCLLLILLFNASKKLQVEDVPLIVQQRALFAPKSEEDVRLTYRTIQEVRLIKEDVAKNRHYCVRLWHLFQLTARNDHLWWGICFRANGSSYNHTQRISVMMVRLLTTMAVSALFYGLSKDSTLGDLSLTFYESLIGFIPVFIIETLIRQRRPSSKEMKKYSIQNDSRISRLRLRSMSGITSVSATSVVDSEQKSGQTSAAQAGPLRQPSMEAMPPTATTASALPATLKHIKSQSVLDMEYAAAELEMTLEMDLKGVTSKKHSKRNLTQEGRVSTQLKQVETKKLFDILKNEDQIGTLKQSMRTLQFTGSARDDEDSIQIDADYNNDSDDDEYNIATNNAAHKPPKPQESLASPQEGAQDSENTTAGAGATSSDAAADAAEPAEEKAAMSAPAKAQHAPTGTTLVTNASMTAGADVIEISRERSPTPLQVPLHVPGRAASVSVSAASGVSENEYTVDLDRVQTRKRGRSVHVENAAQMKLAATKLKIFNEIRGRLFDQNYTCPSWCKQVTICLIAGWSIGCALVTTLWCMWFDQKLSAQNAYNVETECSGASENIDIPEQTFANWNETQSWLASVNGTYQSWYVPPSDDTFGDDLTVSGRFMLAVLISYMLAIFLWQPLLLLLRSVLVLRSWTRNPDQPNEAMLFYDVKNLINVDDINIDDSDNETPQTAAGAATASKGAGPAGVTSASANETDEKQKEAANESNGDDKKSGGRQSILARFKSGGKKSEHASKKSSLSVLNINWLLNKMSNGGYDSSSDDDKEEPQTSLPAINENMTGTDKENPNEKVNDKAKIAKDKDKEDEESEYESESQSF